MSTGTPRDPHPRRDGQRHSTPKPPRVFVQPEDDPSVMLQLGEGDFYNLVDKDVRGGLDAAIADKLRDERVCERWYQTLLRMKRAVEGTISARSSENKAFQIQLRNGWHDDDGVWHERELQQAEEDQAKFLKWRAGSIRFKTGVEEKLTEASWRRRMSTTGFLHSAAQTERNEFAQRNRLLEAELAVLHAAIQRHREEIDPSDASEIDEELWRAGESAEQYVSGVKVSVDGHAATG